MTPNVSLWRRGFALSFGLMLLTLTTARAVGAQTLEERVAVLPKQVALLQETLDQLTSRYHQKVWKEDEGGVAFGLCNQPAFPGSSRGERIRHLGGAEPK